MLTFSSFFVAKALDKSVDTVLLPTPPFPERTKIFRLTFASFPAITDIAENAKLSQLKLHLSLQDSLSRPYFLFDQEAIHHTSTFKCVHVWTLIIPGSGKLALPDEQIVWLGQPSHADALPALSLCVPGQSTKNYILNNFRLLFTT